MGTETVTVVFTDLVGSTELLSRVGEERAAELRREHFTLVGDAIETADGSIVKTMGDGLMAVFTTPSAALDAVVGIQQQAELRNRRATEPFEIRIGMSLGEADAEDDDYFGIPVVEAARLCDAAAGAQVLVTDVVRALAGGRGNHQFTSVGMRELKGLPASVAVCEVGWARLSGGDVSGVPLPSPLARRIGVPFVGRDTECAVLMDALKGATSSNPRHVLVSGEAGIGKTTLLTEFATIAHDRGAIVLFGRCDEDLSIPYQPWREVFAHLDRHLPSALDPNRDDLAALLPGGQPAADADPDAARYVLYGAVVDALRRAASEWPVIVILDDLHWADAPTAGLVRHLAQSAVSNGVTLVATFRDAELDAEHPLTATLAALRREPAVDRLAMRGFDDRELLDLMEAMAGHELDDDGQQLRDALRAETDGNPFFATEVLRHLAETGSIARSDEGQWTATTDIRLQGLPLSVREVIGLRVGRLGNDVRHALRHASAIGREFDLDLLGELLGEDTDAINDLLSPAIQSGVLADVAPNRFSFSHALIGHALYDEMRPTPRARVHHDLAEILERRLGEDPGERAGELARHWALATAPQDGGKAAVYARRAGDYALEQLAPAEAIRWYEQALELTSSRDRRGHCQLLVALGDAQRQAGVGKFRETLLAACKLAIELDESALLVQAALTNTRGPASEFGEIDHDRIAMLRAAIAIGRDPADGATLRANLAAELMTYDIDEARRLVDDAMTLARQSKNDRTFARAVLLTSPVLHCPARIDDLWETMLEAEFAAERTNDAATQMRGAVEKHIIATARADFAEADRWFSEAMAWADRVPEPWLQWFAVAIDSTRQLTAGNLGASDALAQRALELGTETAQPNAFRFYAVQLFEIRRAQGRLDELIDVLESAAADARDLPVYRAGLAVAHCDLENPDAARQRLMPDVAEQFANYPFDVTWSTAMLLAAEACANLGEIEGASLIAEKLAPWRHQSAYAAINCGGSLARGLGLALRTCGRLDEAVDAFEQALEVNGRLRAPILIARTELDLARTLQEIDPVRARALSASALSTAERLGLGTIARRGGVLLDEMG